MLTWLKLSHHRHSGRLRPHEHTSYLPLGILLLVVGLALTSYTVIADSHPAPQLGSVGLSGVVPSKPPVTAATIKSPTSGKHFDTTPITITGTCPPTTLVELFKNNIFAGSTPCADDGTYSIEIDLMNGQNTLIARVYDALNQAGPDSNSISVSYDVLPTQAGALTPLDFGGSQLLLNTDAVFRGAFPSQALKLPVSIIGGSAPYALNIQWGDSTNKIVPRNDNVEFTIDHAYTKPGTYQISLQASDADGRVAFLTVAAIVNGQPQTSAAGTTGNDSSGSGGITASLLALWPLYTSAVAIVISFWLGERREKRMLAPVSALH